MKKKILIVLAIVLVLIQFIRIDKTNPEVIVANDFIEVTKPNAEISSMIKTSCYDCHSNQSVYPWYSNIAPISFLLKSHIKGGRNKFNFSEWNQYSLEERKEILHECAEEVEEKVMPMKSYANLHSEAKLTEEQRARLVSYFEAM